MKDFNYPIIDHLKKGLSPKYNHRNQPFLSESLNAFPKNDKLQTVASFTAIDTSSLGTLSCPYPQLFVFSDCIIVCTRTAMYEYDGTSLTKKVDSLLAGNTWDALDFKTYILLTNGITTVIKKSTTGEYVVDADLPAAVSVCNYNGQVLIGSPKDPHPAGLSLSMTVIGSTTST